MPQRIILHRPPLLSLCQAPLTNGCVSAAGPLAANLYQALLKHQEDPETWLGLFELSCLLFKNPMEEPAARRILAALEEGGEGDASGDSLPGDAFRQLRVARAALSVAEFSCDKAILQRLSRWCRQLEIKWDALIGQSRVRIAPADWMEFLVRFYQATGLKAILRLCTRLRSGAMDWATALHSAGRQKKRENVSGQAFEEDFLHNRLDEQDFFTRQQILSHGELLADGMRYAALSAVFSGNGQELSAGKNGWRAIRKNHRAVCGGTTGAPFLGGLGSDQPVSLAVLSAWVEAFSAQLMLGDSEWALDEMVRIMENGFSWALRQNPVQTIQYVNVPDPSVIPDPARDPAGAIHALSRAAHAASLFYRYAVTVGRNQIRINYFLPGKYAFHGGKNALLAGEDEIRIQRAESGYSLLVFSAATETRKTVLEKDGETYSAGERGGAVSALPEGRYASFDMNVQAGTVLRLVRCGVLAEEETHHQGICCFADNRLLALPVQAQDWRIAARGSPAVTPEGEAELPCADVLLWKERNGLPADLPVLPKTGDAVRTVRLHPYAWTSRRMAVLPRVLEP